MNQWESAETLASDVPAGDERAEVIIPDYPEINETSLRLSQIRVTISNFTLSSKIQKRFPILPIAFFAARTLFRRGAKAAIRYVYRKIKKIIKDKIKEEIKEAVRSLKLRAGCELWHKFDSGVNNQALPPCPCNKNQATVDDRYTEEENWEDYIRQEYFNRNAATNGCYRQSDVGYVINIFIFVLTCLIDRFFGPSQQCCYGDDGNILTGTDGGSAYSVYPSNLLALAGKFVHW